MDRPEDGLRNNGDAKRAEFMKRLDRARDMELCPIGDRLMLEEVSRAELASGALRYGHSFLDDCTRALLATDLVLIGAWTGAGKTAMSTSIAMANALDGKSVAFFALEAEHSEIERRAKFEVMQRLSKQRGLPPLYYSDWYLGRGVTAGHRISESDAHAELVKSYGTLSTFYKHGPLDMRAITNRMTLAAPSTDLFIVDHLHYVDFEDDNENRALRDAMSVLRDTSISLGKPVILVVQLRKRESGPRRGVVPSLDDIHGSSNIAKIATTAIMMAQAPADPENDPPPHISRTLIHVPKDRRNGATGLVALCEYDRDLNKYSTGYQLGRAVGDRWSPISEGHRPRWAKGHRAMVTNDIGGTTR